MHPPHLHVSRSGFRHKRLSALVLVGLVALTSCGDSEEYSPQPSDPWPVSSPPEDPSAWMADQRESDAAPGTTDSTDNLAVEVSTTPVGTDYKRAGAGLSLESSDLADERLSADNPDLVRVLDQLDQPTLRFGGNSTDRRFFFTDSDEPTPDDWPLRPGERITVVTPEDLERLAELSEATDAQIILSANLAAEDPDRAASLVEHADAALGDRLVGVMIGNEPNGFYLGADNPLSIKDSSWDLDTFEQQWESYVEAIRQAVPETRIVGPGAYDVNWWHAIANSGVTNTTLAVHQYPLSECGDPGDANYQDDRTPTIANTVSQDTRDRVDQILGRAVEIGADASMDTWITETSASSCSGSNDLTETLAAGLYSADYVLRAQSLGVDRVDFHSSLLPCAGGPPMSVLCASGTLQNPGEAFVPRTNGLALALVGALPQGEFSETTIQFNDDGPVPGAQGESVTAYAVAHDDGSTSVVLVDFRDPETSENLPVTLTFPQATGSVVQTALGGADLTDNYPETTLFDGESAGGATSDDDDGVAMDIRGATSPVEDGRPSVDGYGLPLLPPRLQQEVTGVQSGDQVIETMISPGSVSVISARPL